MKNKLAQLGIREVTSLILIATVLLVLVVFVGNLNASQEKQNLLARCKAQLTVASEGKPVGFNDCYSSNLVFEKDVAEKRLLLGNKVRNIKSYEYEDIITKLKEKGLISEDTLLENGDLPAELIYYILAEDSKFCFDVYYGNNFRTFTQFRSENSHMCHLCSRIFFDDSISFENVSMKELDSFIKIMPVENEELSYYDYFKSRYSHKKDSKYQKNAELSSNKIYNLVMTYDKVPKDELPGYIEKKEDYYVSSSHIALLNQDFYADICSCLLNMAPKEMNAEGSKYEDLLNEGILFMI